MDAERFCSIAVSVFAIVVIVSAIFIAGGFTQRDDTKTKLSTGNYTYYYNGQKVDGDTIDIDLYRYTVDDSNLVVYLTDKPQTRVLPMVVPVG